MKKFLFGSIVLAGMTQLAPLSGCIIEASDPYCGDGIIDADRGEVCDDGNIANGDGCSSACTAETNLNCGNGTVETGETCDDGNVASGDGCSATCQDEAGFAVIGFAWTFKTNGANVACPAGVTSIRSVTRPHGVTNATQDRYSMFNCAAGEGVASGYLPYGNYDYWVEAYNGSTLYATSTAVQVDTQSDKDLNFEIHTDKGYFFTNWVITKAAAPSTCAAVGATSVEIVPTDSGSNLETPTRLDCNLGAGYSVALPVDNYTLAVQALDSGTLGIGAPFNFTARPIVAPNGINNLGTSMLVFP